MSNEPVVVCSHLVKVYDSASGRVQAVRGVDLEIDEGTATAIVGPSGSGKSSLLRMIAGLDRPTAGSALIAGIDLFSLRPGRRARLRGSLVALVFQRPSDNLFSHLTARQQLARLGGDEDILSEILADFGLEERADHTPDRLSGGEKQRLAFARAVVSGHRLVIADEPTSQLDGESARATLDAISHLVDRGASVLVATHDDRVLERMSSVIVLRDGTVATITSGGEELAVIDRSGRIQLPPTVRDNFPGRRARLRWDQDTRRLTVDPP